LILLTEVILNNAKKQNASF